MDKLAPNSAEKALSRHLWYIMPEMIPLSFFNSVVSTIKIERIASKLLLCKPLESVICPSTCFGCGFGKLDFPSNVDKSTSPSELITKGSCFFLHHAIWIFLLENPSSLPSLDSYRNGLKNIDAWNVVNNCTEHGVKLSADFAPYARYEDHY